MQRVVCVRVPKPAVGFEYVLVQSINGHCALSEAVGLISLSLIMYGNSVL